VCVSYFSARQRACVPSRPPSAHVGTRLLRGGPPPESEKSIARRSVGRGYLYRCVTGDRSLDRLALVSATAHRRPPLHTPRSSPNFPIRQLPLSSFNRWLTMSTRALCAAPHASPGREAGPRATRARSATQPTVEPPPVADVRAHAPLVADDSSKTLPPTPRRRRSPQIRSRRSPLRTAAQQWDVRRSTGPQSGGVVVRSLVHGGVRA
jgi:hypothetical protein